MNWQEVCTDSNLQNLPYKIELNKWGKIVMSPVKVYHSIFQGKIIRKIYELLGHGEVLTECAIQTSKGTKVTDAAWLSKARLEIVKNETECSIAPEICVEVISESNTAEEMREKRELYFEAGAKEVWICNEDGEMAFYNSDANLESSQLVPGFPGKIDL